MCIDIFSPLEQETMTPDVVYQGAIGVAQYEISIGYEF